MEPAANTEALDQQFAPTTPQKDRENEQVQRSSLCVTLVEL
jgi:hypothetical protein